MPLTHDVAFLLAVSLGPRPKDLHTQVPKSRPLSEKGAELTRKRRIKKLFGSFNKGPFKGKDCVLDRART